MKCVLRILGICLLGSSHPLAGPAELDVRLDKFDPQSGRYSITIVNNSVTDGFFVEMESLKRGSFSLKMPKKSTGRGGGVSVHPVEETYCNLTVKNPKYPTNNAKTLNGILTDFPNSNHEWTGARMELSFLIHGMIEGNGEWFIVCRRFQFSLGEQKLPLLGTDCDTPAESTPNGQSSANGQKSPGGKAGPPEGRRPTPSRTPEKHLSPKP